MIELNKHTGPSRSRSKRVQFVNLRCDGRVVGKIIRFFFWLYVVSGHFIIIIIIKKNKENTRLTYELNCDDDGHLCNIFAYLEKLNM